MKFYAVLDVGGNSRAICIVDETGKIVWQCMLDRHLDIVAAALKRCPGKLEQARFEAGSLAPHLCRDDRRTPARVILTPRSSWRR